MIEIRASAMCWSTARRRCSFSTPLCDKGSAGPADCIWPQTEKFAHITYTEAIEILEKHKDAV